jgi:hypothetical protein
MPDKAIWLEQGTLRNEDGTAVSIAAGGVSPPQMSLLGAATRARTRLNCLVSYGITAR